MSYASAVALTPIEMVAMAATSVATLAAADGTNGNKFSANKRTMLRVKNGSGSIVTVTVHSNYSISGLALPDKTFTVAATTGDVIFSGFQSFQDEVTTDSDIDVWIEFSAVTTVTVQVLAPLD